MKKIVIMTLFFFSCQMNYCQIIKGVVFDSSTNKEISSVSIYFSGTYVGTTSDKEGNFELNISKNKNMPLTISAVGYYSVTLEPISEDKTIKVMLKPKIYKVKDVNIKAKSFVKKRKMYLKFFKEEFLGYDYESMKCEIENENDITFNYDSDKDTLKAFARNPIRITNKSLGYKITYFLDKFEYRWKGLNTAFEGNLIFQDVADSNHSELFDKLRYSVYQGSRMHFFRTLWANNLSSTQFNIKNENRQPLNVSEVVKQVDGDKYLSYPKVIIVNYNKKISQLVFLEKLVYFDKSGYFDGSGINWRGEMGIQRIADTLPNEYVTLETN